ncbi:uncharacterized protein LOC114725433 [Neltuma alba]|uniref:uncharacterized protein LOC114725433 n=1 Tax=Neltuma alba TaxID=207710 RepID=UPI0010A47B1A|nr:uncharacterized protein LOC114725433 [Prosopis alba]
MKRWWRQRNQGLQVPRNLQQKKQSLVGNCCTLLYSARRICPRNSVECLYGIMKLIPNENTTRRGRIRNPSCCLRVGTERFYHKGKLPPTGGSASEVNVIRRAWKF